MAAPESVSAAALEFPEGLPDAPSRADKRKARSQQHARNTLACSYIRKR
jgi:hypothetical protein